MEEQTAESNDSEVAATSMAPTKVIEDAGQFMGEHITAPFKNPPAKYMVEQIFEPPAHSSMDEIDLAVKWGLLDVDGMSNSLGTHVMRSLSSKILKFVSRSAVKEASNTKSYSEVAKPVLEQGNDPPHIEETPILSVQEVDTPVKPVSHMNKNPMDVNHMIKIEVVDKYIEPKGFVRPKKTVKTLKITCKALDTLPRYFPSEFANDTDCKALRDIDVIEHSIEKIKEIFGRSPNLPFDDIFQDITGTGELYLDEYIVLLPSSPLTPFEEQTFVLVNSPHLSYNNSISSFSSSEQEPVLSDISSFNSDEEAEDLQCVISNLLVTYRSEPHWYDHGDTCTSSSLRIPMNAIVVEVEEAKATTSGNKTDNKVKDKGKKVDSSERGLDYDKLFKDRKQSKSKNLADKKINFGPNDFQRDRSELLVKRVYLCSSSEISSMFATYFTIKFTSTL
ncbi:hypothetical protein BDQ17DRAFT_1438039 [Cyathus striatus]|nr:hypothetical protein BDQ17DRAFT_1438039 [Cyathus striatus]